MPTLVAMARSGETFITRSGRNGLWLHVSPGAGGAGPVDEATVARAVADHGFTRIDRRFDSWDDLEDFRQLEAAKFAPPPDIDQADLDGADVLEMLGDARRWADEGEAGLSRRLLLRLLLVPAALADLGLHRELVAALAALGEPYAGPQLRHQPDEPLKVGARDRWQTLVPAA